MGQKLESIPGVGRNMAKHMEALGYHSVESLRGADPEEMYHRECVLRGEKMDRCCLYVYRLAVAWAEGRITTPEQSKWWNWKDPDGPKMEGF